MNIMPHCLFCFFFMNVCLHCGVSNLQQVFQSTQQNTRAHALSKQHVLLLLTNKFNILLLLPALLIYFHYRFPSFRVSFVICVSLSSLITTTSCFLSLIITHADIGDLYLYSGVSRCQQECVVSVNFVQTCVSFPVCFATHLCSDN